MYCCNQLLHGQFSDCPDKTFLLARWINTWQPAKYTEELVLICRNQEGHNGIQCAQEVQKDPNSVD